MPQTGQKYQVARIIDDSGKLIGGETNPITVNIDGDKSGDEAKIIDTTTTADTVYIGVAEISSETSAAVWKIKKLDTSSGVVITWADGNANYDNIFDNIDSLDYS